jgi:hypothetical protein
LEVEVDARMLALMNRARPLRLVVYWRRVYATVSRRDRPWPGLWALRAAWKYSTAAIKS